MKILQKNNEFIYRREDQQELWLHPEAVDFPSAWFETFLGENPPVEPVKDSHSRKTYRWESPAGAVYVKVFTYADSDRRGDWLRDFFDWKKQGKRQFKKVLQLDEEGFNVARPLLALEQKVRPWRWRSLVVYEEIEGTEVAELVENLTRGKIIDYFIRGLRVLHQMHTKNIAYGDARVFNQLIDSDGNLAWIDYDDLKINYRWWPSKWRDLRRYLQSWVILIGREQLDVNEEELFRLFHEYAGWNRWVRDFIIYRIEP